jgi:hypothetical protein
LTFDVFGLNITKDVAMSSEMLINDFSVVNAGIILMNIPCLKASYDSFIKFIIGHVENASFALAPSDQGAYMGFYKPTYVLSTDFNAKPYWNISKETFNASYILHFHGAKPHDYIKSAIGLRCNTAIQTICRSTEKMPVLCESMNAFASFVAKERYCMESFLSTIHIQQCIQLLSFFSGNSVPCSDFESLKNLSQLMVQSFPHNFEFNLKGKEREVHGRNIILNFPSVSFSSVPSYSMVPSEISFFFLSALVTYMLFRHCKEIYALLALGSFIAYFSLLFYIQNIISF